MRPSEYRCVWLIHIVPNERKTMGGTTVDVRSTVFFPTSFHTCIEPGTAHHLDLRWQWQPTKPILVIPCNAEHTNELSFVT